MINQWLWRRFGVCPMCVPIWACLRMEDTAGKKQLAVLMIFWRTLMIHRWIYGYPIFNLWFEQVDEGRAEGMVPTCLSLCCRPGVHLQNVFPNSNQTWLVVSTPLKNMKVSWDDYSKYMENIGKPPARSGLDFCRQICCCLQSDMAGNQSFAIHTHLQINSVNPIINHPAKSPKKSGINHPQMVGLCNFPAL